MSNKPLARPIAIVDEVRCRKNIKNMVEKATKSNTVLRPHFKTHQSLEIGRWFREHGVTGITVSTPEMARYFAKDGWDDITLAFPFYPGQVEDVMELQKSCDIRLFVSDVETVSFVEKNLEKPIKILIEADAGYNRSGTADLTKIDTIIHAAKSSKFVQFYGFYSHDGDTYKVKGKKQIKDKVERNYSLFAQLKEKYPNAKFCIGDTPSCCVMDDFRMVDEISPGNFIFFDWMQTNIGSCSINEIGLLVKVPIAQLKEKSDQLIVHGGAVHLSKDCITVDGVQTYGQPVYFDEDLIKPIPGAYVTSLSQEHGIIQGAKQVIPHINSDNSVWICPVHSCLTANLFGHYQTSTGTTIEKKILS
ncbi:MAG: alanine racemase [Balneolaceae bacterium]